MKKSSEKNTPKLGGHLPWNYGVGLQRGTLLLRRLRAAIDGISSRALTYEDWFEVIGEPKSTLGNWLNGDGQPSPEALLRMVEMLPSSLRHQILDEPAFCRCRPVVDHPRLSHDQVKVSCLKTIISKMEGITLVQGERETLVTFLVAALGHSCRILSTRRRAVLGLDSHAPDWFVPVPNVTYFDNVLHTQKLHLEFEKAWPRISNSKGALIILNGVWSQLPGFNEKARALAQHCHVVLGDKLRPQPVQTSSSSTHIITVAADRIEPKQIQVAIQAI
jgi:hypothetical protein